MPKGLKIYPNHACIGLPDGSILLTGGVMYHQRGISILSKCFKFNPYTKKCYEVGPLLTPRFQHQMVNFNNRIICIGGYEKYGENLQMKNVEIFDQKLEIWQPFGSLDLLKERRFLKILMHDRKLHVFDVLPSQKTIYSAVRYSPKEKCFLKISNPTSKELDIFSKEQEFQLVKPKQIFEKLQPVPLDKISEQHQKLISKMDELYQSTQTTFQQNPKINLNPKIIFHQNKIFMIDNFSNQSNF